VQDKISYYEDKYWADVVYDPRYLNRDDHDHIEEKGLLNGSENISNSDIFQFGTAKC